MYHTASDLNLIWVAVLPCLIAFLLLLLTIQIPQNVLIATTLVDGVAVNKPNLNGLFIKIIVFFGSVLQSNF